MESLILSERRFATVLSRNNFLSVNKISSVNPQALMRKLNKRKIRWIVRESERRELGAWTIAQQHGITPSGGSGGDYAPPKPKEKGKENATLPKPIPQAEEEEKKESGEFKNATLADKIQSELEKRIKNRTVRVIVSV